MLYIDPEECIDCDACVEACPVDACFAEDQLPEEWTKFVADQRGLLRRTADRLTSPALSRVHETERRRAGLAAPQRLGPEQPQHRLDLGRRAASGRPPTSSSTQRPRRREMLLTSTLRDLLAAQALAQVAVELRDRRGRTTTGPRRRATPWLCAKRVDLGPAQEPRRRNGPRSAPGRPATDDGRAAGAPVRAKTAPSARRRSPHRSAAGPRRAARRLGALIAAVELRQRLGQQPADVGAGLSRSARRPRRARPRGGQCATESSPVRPGARTTRPRPAALRGVLGGVGGAQRGPRAAVPPPAATAMPHETPSRRRPLGQPLHDVLGRARAPGLRRPRQQDAELVAADRGRRARPRHRRGRRGSASATRTSAASPASWPLWSLMSLRLSMSNIASARSWPSRRASTCATSRRSSNARRFARPVSPSRDARAPSDLREDLGAADRAADLDADRVQEARVAVGERRRSRGPRVAYRSAPIPPAEHDRHGDAAVLAERLQQLALDVRQVGVVERRRSACRRARARSSSTSSPSSVVDLVGGAALLAGPRASPTLISVRTIAPRRRASARSTATRPRSRRAPPRRRSRARPRSGARRRPRRRPRSARRARARG